MKRGLLTVVSGFSGAGKGTITKKLLQDYENYALSISATTRSPREGERHGKEYFFTTKERFEEMIAGEELVEYASYCGNYYGTPAPYVREQLEQGLDVILEIEMQGALKIKKKFPQALLIFVVWNSVLRGGVQRVRSRLPAGCKPQPKRRILSMNTITFWSMILWRKA